MKNFTYNNNTVNYATITRAHGYGQYTMKCDWLDANGEWQTSSLHTTDSQLFDDYHCRENSDERYLDAVKLIAERVIDNFYSI